MNIYRLNTYGRISFVFEDKDTDPAVWYEDKNGNFVLSDRSLVKAVDNSWHFIDEVTDEDLEAIARDTEQTELWSRLRADRNARIAATDYMLLPDVNLSEDKRAKVLTYRQALRDLPAQAGAPWDGGPNVPWPVLER